LDGKKPAGRRFKCSRVGNHGNIDCNINKILTYPAVYLSIPYGLLTPSPDAPIRRIRAKSTIDALRPIAAKAALETLKRLIHRIYEIMVFAVNIGIIDTNPLSGISKAFESHLKRNMPTLRPEQLLELMGTITITIANASIKKTTRCLIEWQLHTITRPSEAAGTRWEEIGLIKARLDLYVLIW
jgi:integrase